MRTKTVIEKIARIEKEVSERESILLMLYTIEVKSTRIFSDESRKALLDDIYDNIILESDLMKSVMFCRGFYDMTDRKLLESWFEANQLSYSSSTVWQNCLSTDLGAVAIIADLLNNQGDKAK